MAHSASLRLSVACDSIALSTVADHSLSPDRIESSGIQEALLKK